MGFVKSVLFEPEDAASEGDKRVASEWNLSSTGV